MKPTTPDKGYAWVVLLASLGCNYLSGVLVYFVGVIHVELLNKYHDDVTTTAWAGAVYSSLQMLGAPLATWLVHRFSCRVSVALGGVLLLIGFTVSAFATSVLQLVFTYGLIAGTGLGLTYSPTLMIITFYFDKFRALASGISVSGCAVGILSGSLLTQSLIDTYGLTGAFLMIAGLGFNSCVFAMFFRPTDHGGQRKRSKQASLETDDIHKRCPVNYRKGSSGNLDRADEALFMNTGPEKPFDMTLLISNGDCVEASESRTDETLQIETPENAVAVDSNLRGCDASHACENWESVDLLNKGPEQNGEGVLSSQTDMTQKDKAEYPAEKSLLSQILGQFRGVMPLIKNQAFLSHCASVLFAGINMSGVYLHLPEYSRTLGTTPTQAAALFVGVGILSLVSRLGSGFLLTSPRVNALLLSVSLMGLCGVAASLFPLYSATYVGQMAFASLFGLSTGGFFTLINVLTVELVAFTNLAAAYGMLIFVMGIGYVAGPPLAAMIVDFGGTYEHSFIFLGMAMFASAAFDLLAKVIHKRQGKQRGNESHQDNRQGKQH